MIIRSYTDITADVCIHGTYIKNVIKILLKYFFIFEIKGIHNMSVIIGIGCKYCIFQNTLGCINIYIRMTVKEILITEQMKIVAEKEYMPVEQLRQLVAEGEEDLAYRAFYALTIIYRNRKDYQQLQALFEENPHFAGHPSYHHLLILFQLEAETFFDALELLELAREDARQHRDNAGYLHLFAHLFVYTCEKSRGEMREQVRREYYDDVERAVEDAIRLDPAYAKFYCTKARVVAQRGRYAEAYSLINKAVATESSARKDYALRLLDYRHCETVILLQEQREYFQGEMEKLRRSVPSLPKPKTFVPGRGPKAYEGAEPYCFVSYAHINSDRVYPIVEQLMQRGIRLWYDDGIEAGSDFREFIAEKIRDSWQVLLFASTSPSSRALSAMRSTTLCTAASPSCG